MADHIGVARDAAITPREPSCSKKGSYRDNYIPEIKDLPMKAEEGRCDERARESGERDVRLAIANRQVDRGRGDEEQGKDGDAKRYQVIEAEGGKDRDVDGR